MTPSGAQHLVGAKLAVTNAVILTMSILRAVGVPSVVATAS